MPEEPFNQNNENHMETLKKFISENKDKLPKIPFDSEKKE